MTVKEQAKETGKKIAMNIWHIVAVLIGLALLIAAFMHTDDIMKGVDKLVDSIFKKMKF